MVLPEPLGPRMVRNSPSATVSETWSSAVTRHLVQHVDGIERGNRIEFQRRAHDFTRRPSSQTDSTLSTTLTTAISVLRQ